MEKNNRGLIVSPDPGFVNQARGALRREGALIEHVSTAEEALGSVVAEGATVVVAEVDLPGASGYRLCMDLKELPDPPVVVLVHLGSDSRAGQRASEAGADETLRRPFAASHLVARVRALVGEDFFEASAEEKDPDADRSAMSLVEPASGLFGYAGRDPEASAWADSVVSQAVLPVDAGSTQELPAMALELFDEEHPVSVPVNASTTAHFHAVEDEGRGLAEHDVRRLVQAGLRDFAAPGGPLANAIQATVQSAIADALKSVLPAVAAEAARRARDDEG
jgi:CheY-like chemotaxis protein